MKKSIWIFLLAVLLPGAVLGWLALRSAGEQQIIFERRTAELYQKETEDLAAAVRETVETERRAFSDVVHRLLGKSDAEELARDFTNTLSDAWSRKAVGFAIGPDGRMLSPSETLAAKDARAREFVWDNRSFLCSSQPAIVYPVPVSSVNKSLSYGSELKQRGQALNEQAQMQAQVAQVQEQLAAPMQQVRTQQQTAPPPEPEPRAAIVVRKGEGEIVMVDEQKPAPQKPAQMRERSEISKKSDTAVTAPSDKVEMPDARGGPAPLVRDGGTRRGGADVATKIQAEPVRPKMSDGASDRPEQAAESGSRAMAPKPGAKPQPAIAPSIAAPIPPPPAPATAAAPAAEPAAPMPIATPGLPTAPIGTRRAANPLKEEVAKAKDSTVEEKSMPGRVSRSAPSDEGGLDVPPTRQGPQEVRPVEPSKADRVASEESVEDRAKRQMELDKEVKLQLNNLSYKWKGAQSANEADQKRETADSMAVRGFADPASRLDGNDPTVALDAQRAATGVLGGSALNVDQALNAASNNTAFAGTDQTILNGTGAVNANGTFLFNRQVEPARNLRAQTVNWSAVVPETAEFRALTANSEEGMVSRFVQDKLGLIFWIRPPECPEIVFGCLIEVSDFHDLWKNILGTGNEPDARSGKPGFVLALLDDRARPVTTFPRIDGARDWKRPFVASEIGEALPHWETALYLATPTALADSARALGRTLSFTIAGAVALIALGGWLVVADVRRQLALAQKKTDFVSNVSHELKTPLTSIRMFAELMHDRPPPAEKQGQYLRIITAEAERLTRLINNVLDFAKLERRQKRFEKNSLDLCAVITRVWEGHEMHLRDAGFTTKWEAAPGPYPVTGDEDALAQILVNLLSNAEKYSSERKEVELVTWIEDNYINVSILDCGIGVPDGEERKIFESFYRAHDSLSSGIQGSGLGLTLAQRLAREHGGDIIFERRSGGGSRFTLRLPLVDCDELPGRSPKDS